MVGKSSKYFIGICIYQVPPLDLMNYIQRLPLLQHSENLVWGNSKNVQQKWCMLLRPHCSVPVMRNSLWDVWRIADVNFPNDCKKANWNKLLPARCRLYNYNYMVNAFRNTWSYVLRNSSRFSLCIMPNDKSKHKHCFKRKHTIRRVFR